MAAAAPSVSVTCSAPSGRIRSGSDVDPGDPLCKWLTAQLRMSNLLPGRMPECSKLCGHLFAFIIHVCPASTFIDLLKATNRLITSIPANDCNTTRMTVRGSADHSVALRARPARQARDQRGEYRVRRWPVGSHPWMALATRRRIVPLRRAPAASARGGRAGDPSPCSDEPVG